MIHLEPQPDRTLFEDTVAFAAHQVRRMIESHPDFYPMYTRSGKWRHDMPAWTHWCDGFLPGMMWILHSRAANGSEASWWREQAIRYTRPLEPRKHDRDVHDLGFIFMSTYHRWFRLTKEAGLKEVLIEAGRTLALRYREKGQYLRSFVEENSLFIDIMMNVGLIFYVAQQTHDEKLLDIAMKHSLTTRRFLVRGDGSTAHEGLFDVETGEFLQQSTHQGFRGDSCWSRGLAWALYGFGNCYLYTRDPRFLKTAESCADFYISHAPADGVPPWDFDAPAEARRLVDTSAAAIAASGLFQLSQLLPDRVKGLFYASAARHILRTLCTSHLSKGDTEWEGVLKGGIYHLHKNLGVNESVMWGEYFCLEALDRALGQRAGTAAAGH